MSDSAIAVAPSRQRRTQEDGEQKLTTEITEVTRIARVYDANFAVSRITIDPADNYRWRDEKGMEADLAIQDVKNDDGTTTSSYETLKISIAASGVDEPVGLIPRGDKMHIVYGFTRVVVARDLKLKTIPAFIHDENMSQVDIDLLQARENSKGLKRDVNWVKEVEMYQRCVEGLIRDGIDPKTAQKKVADIIGRGHDTMRNRAFYLKHVDPRVGALAREGRISACAFVEFYSGDTEAKFTKEFVTATIKHLKRNNDLPETISGDAIRGAMRAANRDGVDKFPEGRVAVTTQLTKRRQTPGVLRDASVIMANATVARLRLQVDSPADKLNALINEPEWFTIIGLGMGIGEIPMPAAIALKTTDRPKKDDDDDTTDKLNTLHNQHEAGAERWNHTIFITALMRDAVGRTSKHNFDRWQNAYRQDGEKRLSNLKAFHEIVQNAAINHEHKSFAARVRAAWSGVKDLLTFPLVKEIPKPKVASKKTGDTVASCKNASTRSRPKR